MTISLEEHVARAIQERRIQPDFSATIKFADGSKQWVIDHDAELARAAIAAVREYGEPATGVCNKCGYCGPVERHGFDQGWHPNCNYAASIVPPPDPASIRESERAACEAIVDKFEVDECGPDWGLSNDEQRRRIIARNRVVRGISAAIAARKGTGEGK